MENPLQHESFQGLQSALETEQAHTAAIHKAFAEQLSKVQQALGELARIVDAEQSNLEAAASETQQRLNVFKEFISSDLGGDEEARKRIAELESELNTRAETLRASEERFAALDHQLGEQSAANTAARERISTLESSLQQETERVTRLESELLSREETDESARATVDALRASEQRTRTELETANARLAAVEAAQNDTEMAFERANTEVKASRERIEALETALREGEAKQEGLAGLEAEVQAERGRVNALTAQLADRTRERDDAARRLSESEAGLSVERERAEDLEQKLHEEQARGKKSVLAAQLTDAIREAEEAQEELRKVRDELELLRRERGNGGLQQMLAAAAKKVGAQKRTIGEILVEAGLLNYEQLEQGLEEQRKNPTRHLGAILVDLGLASEDTMAQALAAQCGVELVRLSEAVISAEAPALISERLANQHTCIPIHANIDSLVLAMANPLDLLAIEDIERATNRRVEIVVATPADIKEAITKYYWEPV